MKNLINIFLILSFGLISCKNLDTKKEFSTQLDSIKYINYLKLIDLFGTTFDSFIVIEVKDLNTNMVKEICTSNTFLIGALKFEFKNNYDSILKNKKRYFEFKNLLALNNIGFKEYDIKEYEKYQILNNVDSIVKKIAKKESLQISSFIKNNKDKLYFAHSLFNKGILSGENNCYGSFQIINEKFLQKRSRIKI